VALVGVAHQSGAANGTAATSSRASISRLLTDAPHLTAAEIQQVRQLTPAEAETITTELQKGFAKLGVQVGFGTPDEAQPTGPTLTSYDWSGGVAWDHAWITASDANLAAVANSVNGFTSKYESLFSLVSGIGCGLIFSPVGGIVCGEIAYGISTIAAELSTLPPLTNHGVWAAFYWWPREYWTGGDW
jgi:hypothetical protein